MRYLLMLLFFFSHFSLAQNETENDFHLFLNKLEGLWIVEPSQHPLYEYWELINDGQLKGFGFSLINHDTLISEKLKIINEKSDYYYVAEVTNQNKGNPVYFKLVPNDKMLVFENNEHDFPNRIIYDFQDENLINVTVESSDNENPRQIKLILKRINEK